MGLSRWIALWLWRLELWGPVKESVRKRGGRIVTIPLSAIRTLMLVRTASRQHNMLAIFETVAIRQTDAVEIKPVAFSRCFIARRRASILIAVGQVALPRCRG